MGVVALMPAPFPTLKGFTLQMLLLFLHYSNEIRVYSSYLKLKQHDRKFGSIVASAINQDLQGAAEIVGVPLHWRAVHRHFGMLPETSNDHSFFSSQLMTEDLEWRAAERQLVAIDPAMNFWVDHEYVATFAKDNQVVTFNLMDCSYSYSRSLSYENRSLYYFRQSLWNHLVSKYLSTGKLENQLLSSLS